jgi:DNA-binding transcriptional LysR family regulator
VNKFESLFGRGGLSLDRLRNFVLIAEAGGVSRAANQNATRMSLFSKQIKELETFFGAALTRRLGRTVQLTEAGRQLAQLARAYLSGLEDFQRTCQGVPQTLSIGSGNSVLEWLLLPQIAKLRNALPQTRFELHTGRTGDLVQRLADMSVDLALIREDAVLRPLKCQRLFLMTYSLFVLAPKLTPEQLRAGLGGIPLATSVGGQFREHLAVAAIKAKWDLKIELSCSSFTQAARAVATGAFGGVLPSLARSEFAPREIVEFELPFLKSYARPVAVAWNPRLTAVRPGIARAEKELGQIISELNSKHVS